MKIKLTPPKRSTFWISIVLAALGTIVYVLHGAGILGFSLLQWSWFSPIGFILVLAGLVLLVVGLLVKGI